jgi:hypothetical protein
MVGVVPVSTEIRGGPHARASESEERKLKATHCGNRDIWTGNGSRKVADYPQLRVLQACDYFMRH